MVVNSRLSREKHEFDSHTGRQFIYWGCAWWSARLSLTQQDRVRFSSPLPYLLTRSTKAVRFALNEEVGISKFPGLAILRVTM